MDFGTAEWFVHHPPHKDDHEAWNAINRLLKTPDDTIPAMREWAMKRMQEIVWQPRKGPAMNLDKIREWYAKPPRANDIAGWNEIHKALDTPPGSDHSMREWALKRMWIDMLGANKRNNVAKPATIAQDAPEGQPMPEPVQSVESRLAETVARLEDMREDLAWSLGQLSLLLGHLDEQSAEKMLEVVKKWKVL